jgi:hypothetical protein
MTVRAKFIALMSSSFCLNATSERVAQHDTKSQRGMDTT